MIRLTASMNSLTMSVLANAPCPQTLENSAGAKLEDGIQYRMMNGYRTYPTLEYPDGESEPVPQQLFNQFVDDDHKFDKITAPHSERGRWERQQAAITDKMQEDVINFIYSSNVQEDVGLDLEGTRKLCQQFYKAQSLTALPEGPADSFQEYLARLHEVVCTEVVSSEGEIPQSCLEVVNHIHALCYLLQAIEVWGFTEPVILQAHRLLIMGIDMPHTKWPSYAGKYRTQVVHAGSSNFIVPQEIPKCMKEFFARFDNDLRECDCGLLPKDPIWLATKYAEEFVDIHPFLDGNGRMSRLILNVLLASFLGREFLGPLAQIGGEWREKEEYLGVRIRAGQQTEGPGEMAFLVLKRVQKQMRAWGELIEGLELTGNVGNPE